MHRLTSHFVLGYHGCDQSTAAALVAGSAFVPSTNEWDWLGTGIYFWEANPRRGLDWAEELVRRPGSSVHVPAVVGAVIDLGLCLDLTSQGGIEIVRNGYAGLKETLAAVGRPLPENKGQDLLRRNLDNAVINFAASGSGEIFDTVRGVFTEGEPVYPGGGFAKKTHIQISVRNPDCIKGVFRVPAAHLAPASLS